MKDNIAIYREILPTIIPLIALINDKTENDTTELSTGIAPLLVSDVETLVKNIRLNEIKKHYAAQVTAQLGKKLEDNFTTILSLIEEDIKTGSQSAESKELLQAISDVKKIFNKHLLPKKIENISRAVAIILSIIALILYFIAPELNIAMMSLEVMNILVFETFENFYKGPNAQEQRDKLLTLLGKLANGGQELDEKIKKLISNNNLNDITSYAIDKLHDVNVNNQDMLEERKNLKNCPAYSKAFEQCVQQIVLKSSDSTNMNYHKFLKIMKEKIVGIDPKANDPSSSNYELIKAVNAVQKCDPNDAITKTVKGINQGAVILLTFIRMYTLITGAPILLPVLIATLLIKMSTFIATKHTKQLSEKEMGLNEKLNGLMTQLNTQSPVEISGQIMDHVEQVTSALDITTSSLRTHHHRDMLEASDTAPSTHTHTHTYNGYIKH